MEQFYRAKRFVEDHRRHIPTAALVAGFLFDSVTLGRPDQLFDNIVILFYLVVAGVTIVLLNRAHERGITPRLAYYVIIQFSFGNLASALFIIFGKSGTFAGSWPFLLFFLILLIGNEFTRGRYHQLRFHIGIYYLLLIAYATLLVPVLVRSIGTEVFLVSGILSLIVMGGFLFIVHSFAPRRTEEHKRALIFIVGGIFVLFNVAYFTNLVPPAPLSLRDIGIYHHVANEGTDSYVVQYEAGEWYEFFKHSDTVFHLRAGDTAFCFSSVFAPARLSTPVYHNWEYYDESSRRWVSASRISFAISGGREDGFRGYSEKASLFPGKWRCSVETERGALIGRRTFTIAEPTGPIELITETR